jgi:hypothetical protein
MKRFITITLLLVGMLYGNSYAQETFGRTLNIGIGIGGYGGYYNHISHSVPVIHFDYEFDVARNFTLAPFISFYTYRDTYNYNSGNYKYNETVIPLGVKGTYYFDQLLNANSNWDFYLAGSLGFAFVNANWDNNYPGDKNYYNDGSQLFLHIHIGTEYHFNEKIGVFLDISNGVSTIGLAIHRIK